MIPVAAQQILKGLKTTKDKGVGWEDPETFLNRGSRPGVAGAQGAPWGGGHPLPATTKGPGAGEGTASPGFSLPRQGRGREGDNGASCPNPA